MANSPYQQLGQIRIAVVNDAKEQSSAALVTQVNRWVNEGYEQVILRKKRGWLDQKFSYQFSDATQATAAVTEGIQTVTFEAGTTFPPTNATFELLLYNQGFSEVYDVLDFPGGTVVNTRQPYLGESNTAAACVVTAGSILLDTSIRHVYQAYHNWSPQPLTYMGPQQFREMTERFGPQLGYAQYFTIFGKGNSYTADRMQIYPYPEAAYTLFLDANIYVVPLLADSDEPLIPIQHRQILYHYAMYKLWSYHRNDAKAGEALANFNTMLAKIDGEAMPELDFPQLKVAYPRGRRRSFFPGFDSRLRDTE